jgi:hypothetical protein
VSVGPVVADTFAGRIHVEWDDSATVTPLGQLPFFIEYLKQGGLFDSWVRERGRREGMSTSCGKVAPAGTNSAACQRSRGLAPP